MHRFVLNLKPSNQFSTGEQITATPADQNLLSFKQVVRGEKGDKGDPGDPAVEGALAIINKLSEFDTEQAKADARANLGIAVVDGGTF